MIVVSSPPAAAGGAAANDDFTRVNVVDGSWTNVDPLSQATGAATNVDGINVVPLGTNVADKHLNGCVFYKELKTRDGSDFDFTDKPAFLSFYLHMPETGWRDNGSQEGGDGNPPYASRSWVAMGVLTDPENISGGPTGPYPKDVLGAGLSWLGTNNKMRRTFVTNTSNSGTWGTLSVNSQDLETITSTTVAAGHRATNRLGYNFNITRGGAYTAGALTPADAHESYYMSWRPYFDDGHVYGAEGKFSAGQRWGRSRTNKLYLWVACGRTATPSAGCTMKFDAYYNATLLNSGTNPSGTTILSGP